jgi:ubiquinone/menaquinone biosynthesis C-methylase UbiE
MSDGAPGALTYSARMEAEKRLFGKCAAVHELPPIFHYWSNRHIRPELERFGFSNPTECFALCLRAQLSINPMSHFVSLGAGNCDWEVALAQELVRENAGSFVLDCLDVNLEMLERGRKAAADAGIAECMKFSEVDLNQWTPARSYDVVVANQTLHHVVELESLLSKIRQSIQPHGRFVVCDTIGRNGHQRWPEALEIVQRFWRKLPPSYRYNRLLDRYEERFEDWDCSQEGFEGIRAQDILPLLCSTFHFNLFVGYANAVLPFVDRGFGHNFDPSDAWDRQFIDCVHQADEAGFAEGWLKPTQMIGVLSAGVEGATRFRGRLKPEFCIREPNAACGYPSSGDPTSGLRERRLSRHELERVTHLLRDSDAKLRDARTRCSQAETQAAMWMKETEVRTVWAADLEEKWKERTAWALKLAEEVEQQRLWAQDVDRQRQSLTASLAELARRSEEEAEKSTGLIHRLRAELETRTNWALDAQRQMEERTAWAVRLKSELEAQTRRADALDWRSLRSRLRRLVARIKAAKRLTTGCR